MNYDTVIQTIKGEVTQEPLISLWRHYPGIDFYTDKLVKATYQDYKRFPSDLVKLSPHGRAPVVDFGCKVKPGDNTYGGTGSSSCVSCRIKNVEDWNDLEEIDPLDGVLGQQVEYVYQIRQLLPDIPIMMTIFAPSMVGRKLSNNKLIEHYYEDASSVNNGMNIVHKVTLDYARACIDAGANGIFLAVQEADPSIYPDMIVDPAILSFNDLFVRDINKYSEFVVLHLHGKNVDFRQAVHRYRPTAVNWHDKTSNVNLSMAPQYFDGGLLGGLHPPDLLNENINLHEVIELKDRLPLILAPGCVILQGTSDLILEKIIKTYKNEI